MNLKNEIMLITYADSMGNNLKELHELLNQHYQNAVGGVHILPFFLWTKTGTACCKSIAQQGFRTGGRQFQL